MWTWNYFASILKILLKTEISTGQIFVSYKTDPVLNITKHLEQHYRILKGGKE